MPSLEYLAQHASNVLMSHGITGNSERLARIDNASFSWSEEGGISISIYDEPHELVIHYDPYDYLYYPRARILNYENGMVKDVEQSNQDAMADYILKLIFDD